MKENKTKPKILVCMSGGVDSSVAAALLVSSKKYDVTGAFMVNYDEPMPNGDSCYLPDYRDAVRVAAKLGIPILKLDFTKEYREKVLSYMFSEYEKGRTPNPDVMCNSFVKFGSWQKKAGELGFDSIATGHYANFFNGKLMSAKDLNKDQTYFLHQLTLSQLNKTLFPIGKYTKTQVRALAKKFKLPTAEKEESMGICFIGEVPMKEFLQKRIKPTPGNIVTSSGEIIGQHEGLPFYTIGERHVGVKTNDNEPLYVLAKNIQTNELVVGNENDELLFSKKVELENVNWINPVKLPLKCEVRMRHRQQLQKCRVEINGGVVSVIFNKPERAVTPGQFAVFYKKGECLGGGAVL